MRNFSFFATLFILCILFTDGAAQTTYTLAPTTSTARGGFDVDSGTFSGDSITLVGNTYAVYTTSGGSAYIKLNGAKGMYPFWVCVPTSNTFQGQPVYETTKGSPAVIVRGSKGQPVATWLGADSGDTFDFNGTTYSVRLSKKGKPYILVRNGTKFRKVNLSAN